MKHIETQKPETIGAAILDERATDYQPIQSAAQQLGFAVDAPQEPRTNIHELPALLRTFARKAADTLLAPIHSIVRESYAVLEARLNPYKPAAFPDETVRDLAHLPQAIAAMGERDIASGVTLSDDPTDPTAATHPIPDGMSLAHLLCSSDAANRVTEIVDTNRGWTCNYSLSDRNLFAALKKVKLNCKFVHLPGTNNVGEKILLHDVPNLEDIEFTELEGQFRGILLAGNNKVTRLVFQDDCKFNWYPFSGGRPFINGTLLEELYIPMVTWAGGYDYHNRIIANCSTLKRLIAPYVVRASYGSLFSGCPNLEYVYAPQTINISRIGYDGNNISNLQNLHTWISGGFGQEYYSGESADTQYGSFRDCPKLIHLEAAKTLSVNTDIRAWSPTYILSDNPSGNDLVEDEGIQTNLQQFLVNLRKYICLRLADRAGTTALTLTLSQAVRNAANDSTRTLASLGITTADLTDKERAAGITTATTYAAWFNAYMGAINWNVSPTATN